MNLFDRLKRLLGGNGASSEAGGDGEPSGGVKAIECMEAMARVQEYLDGELDGVSHEEVAQHFAMCKRCFPHLKLEEGFRDLLHRSVHEELCPERVREQVLELLAAEGGGQE